METQFWDESVEAEGSFERGPGSKIEEELGWVWASGYEYFVPSKRALELLDSQLLFQIHYNSGLCTWEPCQKRYLGADLGLDRALDLDLDPDHSRTEMLGGWAV